MMFTPVRIKSVATARLIAPGDSLSKLAGSLRKFDGTYALRYSEYAGWSSLVARRAHNPKVVSSNLTPATILKIESKGLPTQASEALAAFWCTLSVNCPCSLICFLLGGKDG